MHQKIKSTATFKSVRANFDARLARHGGGKMAIAPRPRRGSGGHQADFHRLEEGDAENTSVASVEPLAGSALPPQWVDVVEDVQAMFKEIQVKMDRLAEAHQERLKVRIDESKDAPRDAEIAQLSKAITKRMKEADVKIKLIARDPTGEQDAKVRRNVQVSLALQLQDLSTVFRKEQKTYLARMNQLLPPKIPGLEDSPKMSDDGDPLNSSLLAGRAVSQQEMQALQSAEAMVRAREEEILKIAKSIEELSQLFKELGALVIEQGTLLDRIDVNMSIVVERVEKGVGELEIADKYSKSNRATYCVAILVLLIVIFLGLLVAKLRHPPRL